MPANMVTKGTVNADAMKNMIEVATASLELDIKDCHSTAVPFTVSKENMLLMEFSNASWSLSVKFLKRTSNYVYECAFTLKIDEFPEKLKQGAKLKLSLAGGNYGMLKCFDFESIINFEGNLHYQGSANITLKSSLVISVITSKDLGLTHSAVSASKALADRMSRLLKNDQFSDFVFIVKGSQFKAHRSILAAASEVWQKMFTADYKEKESGTCTVDHIQPEVFKALLDFVYFAKIPENLSELALGLYEAAHYYEIESLKIICIDHLSQSLSASNALQIFGVAHRYNLDLAQTSWEVIKRDCLRVSLPLSHLPTPQEVEELLALKQKEKAIYKNLSNETN